MPWYEKDEQAPVGIGPPMRALLMKEVTWLRQGEDDDRIEFDCHLCIYRYLEGMAVALGMAQLHEDLIIISSDESGSFVDEPYYSCNSA